MTNSGPGAVAWHALDTAATANRLSTGPAGLSGAAVAERLRSFGPNQLPEAPPPSNLKLLLHQLQSPLVAVLAVALVLTVLLADFTEASVIFAVLAINTAIGFFQERRAELAVRSLAQLLAPRARVRRDGRDLEIESAEIVPGDLVFLESGARVPADLRLAETTALRIDESMLTGESAPVDKDPAVLLEQTPLADRTNMAFAGTVVAGGRGRGHAVATGTSTVIGGIAERVMQEEHVQTPLQQRMERLSRLIGAVVAASSVLAFGLGVAAGKTPFEMFLVAVALAVSAVPESLPVAFTVALAVGVRRMAQRRAIVRRLPAVETLGSTTVIGSDKTGTLTENRMTVTRLWAGGKHYATGDGHGKLRPFGDEAAPAVEAPEGSTVHRLLLAGVYVNEGRLLPAQQAAEFLGDPTDVASLRAAAALGILVDQVVAAAEEIGSLPFEPEHRYAVSVRRTPGGAVMFVKGAPEAVLAMCSHQRTEQGLVELQPESVHRAATELAADGLRVISMAESGPILGDGLPRLNRLTGLTFLGLQGMLDPPRAGVSDAIAGCRSAGIRVIMITGDHAATALAIARAVGIVGGQGSVLTGNDLDGMDDDELRRHVSDVRVYARVTPEHKLRIVRALQACGEVVAVTGDGANDAPALKAADIGVAMGRSGTDVAREAADMVLADDNFVSIYAAVREGRVTFENVRNITFFLLATNAAEVVVVLAALLLQWPLVLLPAQILWLNLVTEGVQNIALAFEPGDPSVFRRPPRPSTEGVLSRVLWERTVLAGAVMAAGTLGIFQWELAAGASIEHARTVALTTLVLFEAFQIGNARSEIRSFFGMNPLSNPLLLSATAAAVAVHVAALHLPLAQTVLGLAALQPDAWPRMVLVAFTIVVAMEAHKLVRRSADGGRRR